MFEYNTNNNESPRYKKLNIIWGNFKWSDFCTKKVNVYFPDVVKYNVINIKKNHKIKWKKIKSNTIIFKSVVQHFF